MIRYGAGRDVFGYCLMFVWNCAGGTCQPTKAVPAKYITTFFQEKMFLQCVIAMESPRCKTSGLYYSIWSGEHKEVCAPEGTTGSTEESETPATHLRIARIGARKPLRHQIRTNGKIVKQPLKRRFRRISFTR